MGHSAFSLAIINSPFSQVSASDTSDSAYQAYDKVTGGYKNTGYLMPDVL
jgi:hypothetical protein